MAANVKAGQGQTLVDIAMQELGSAEGLFALALLNGMSVTDDLVTGQAVNVSLTPYSAPVLKAYQDNGYLPASGLNPPNTGTPVRLQGIDYWAIGVDFIAS